MMTDEEYERERAHIRNLYGADPDSVDDPVAKRDQMLSDLFMRSGWTQEKIGEKEEKSRTWVSYRLRFARFLVYAVNSTTVEITKGLTEGRFRSYWEQTKKVADENARFDEVVCLMKTPSEPKQILEIVKPEVASKRVYTRPKTERAQEEVRRILDSGQMPNYTELAEKHKIARSTAQMAVRYEEGRRAALSESPVDETTLYNSLPPTSQEKYRALEKKLRDHMESEFASRLTREITRHIEEYLMPVYGERLRKADLIIKGGAPFTNQEFTSVLLRALHPDTSSPENRTAAFLLLKSREVLLRPEEKDRPLTSGLPTTTAELFAMRKKKR